MSSTAKKAAASKTPASSEKPKRKSLTGEERIAKIEAELAAAKEKNAERATKRSNELRDQQAKLQAKVDETVAKIDEIKAELARLSDLGAASPEVSEDAAEVVPEPEFPGTEDDES